MMLYYEKIYLWRLYWSFETWLDVSKQEIITLIEGKQTQKRFYSKNKEKDQLISIYSISRDS